MRHSVSAHKKVQGALQAILDGATDRALIVEYASALDDYTRLSCSSRSYRNPNVRAAAKRWTAAHDALVKRGREMGKDGKNG